MFRFTGMLFLILSPLFSVVTWAALPCTNHPDALGGYMDADILSPRDLPAAIACAVNYGGAEVIGESSFRTHYNVQINEADIPGIRVEKHAEQDALFNQSNHYSVRFPAWTGRGIKTLVRCEAKVDYQNLPKKSVVITLHECHANAVGVKEGVPLQAMVVFARVKR